MSGSSAAEKHVPNVGRSRPGSPATRNLSPGLRALLEKTNYEAPKVVAFPMDGLNVTTITMVGNVGEIVSDIRLKEDVRRVGETVLGLSLYRFRYRGRPETFEGVMAQDVLKVMPSAVVVKEHGFYAVDYGALGAPFRRVH